MSKPLALDLCSGLGGWAEGLIAAGWDVVGVDIEPRFIGRYPGRLILADILRFSVAERARRRFRLVVASPPCTEPSYRAMPWKRAKALNAAGPPHQFIALFKACFRIAEEIGCPVIVENVKGAQPWVGSAKWHYGSFYLWGDVPAVMPIARKAPKVPGQDWNRFKQTGEVSPHWRMEGIKMPRRIYQRDGHSHTRHLTNPFEQSGVKIPKEDRNGGDWFDGGAARFSSKSDARREASALIAKIPFELAHYIGQVFHPGEERVA